MNKDWLDRVFRGRKATYRLLAQRHLMFTVRLCKSNIRVSSYHKDRRPRDCMTNAFNWGHPMKGSLLSQKYGTKKIRRIREDEKTRNRRKEVELKDT